MNRLTQSDYEELTELRRYKAENEGKALTKAFSRLESLIDSHHDAMISVRAFRVISECLIALRDEVKK